MFEATVPVHRRLLWSAVTDPERLFGAVPNLTVEARTGQAVAARLRLRAGDHSITFRGIARLVEVVPEQLCAVLEIEAVHGRSDGSLDGRLQLRLLAAGAGTRIVIEPDLALSGAAPGIAVPRLTEAAGRLIPRWFARLVEADESVPEAESEARHAPVPLSVVPDATEQEPAESAPGPAAAPAAEPAVAHLAEPHGPTLTLITGDAQDASPSPCPSPKAPLRLVQDAERGEAESAAEADLWSRGGARWPGPVWIVAVAGLGSLGFALLVLRRMLRRG